MSIADFLDPKAIKIGLEGETKQQVLQELVDILESVRKVGDKSKILQSLVEREALGSTGIGQRIAIPHAKVDHINKLVAVLGVSHKGINFDSLDGESVHIIFLYLEPKGAIDQHLIQLGKIFRLLRKASFCKQLKGCKTAEEAFNLIKDVDEK